MGSFCGCCGFSGLAINGDAALLLLKGRHLSYDGAYTPTSPPIMCRYEDSGDYSVTDPDWYRDLILAAVGQAYWDTGDAALWCALDREVYDLLMRCQDVYPDQENNASVTRMTKVLTGIKTRDPSEFEPTLYRKLRDLKKDQSALYCKLAYCIEGSMANDYWTDMYILPVVDQPERLDFVLRRLICEHKLDRMMRIAQQPWCPSVHTAPQEGNEAIMAQLYQQLAELARGRTRDVDPDQP